MRWPLLISLTILCGLELARWVLYFSTSRLPIWRLLRISVECVWASRSRLLVAGTVIGAATSAVLPIPSFYRVVLAVCCVVVLGELVLPPTLLVLGSSSQTGTKVLRAVARSSRLRKTSHLLHLGPWQTSGLVNLRNRDDDKWGSQLTAAMTLAHVIVVDVSDERSTPLMSPDRFAELDLLLRTNSKNAILTGHSTWGVIHEIATTNKPFAWAENERHLGDAIRQRLNRHSTRTMEDLDPRRGGWPS